MSSTGVTFPFLIYTFCHIGLLIRLIFLLREKHRQKEPGLRCPVYFDFFMSSIIFLIIQVGLIIDNLRLFLGQFIGFGVMLQVFTYPAFFLHNVALPGTFILSSYYVHEPISFLHNTWIKDYHILRILSWILALSFSTWGLINLIINEIPNLYETSDYDVIKYTTDISINSFLPLILMSAYLTLIGFCIWKRFLWPWLFVLQLLNLIGQSIPSIAYRTFAPNFWDVVFVFSLVLTQSRVLDLQKMALGKKLLENDPNMFSLEAI